MKELENNSKDKTELRAVAPVKTGFHVGSEDVRKGDITFEWDLSNGNITKAEFETINADFVTKGTVKKLIMRNGCMYCTALNLKNAVKKFKRMSGQ